jgi:hypothetical protein
MLLAHLVDQAKITGVEPLETRLKPVRRTGAAAIASDVSSSPPYIDIRKDSTRTAQS